VRSLTLIEPVVPTLLSETLRKFSAQFHDFRPVRAQIAPWAQSTTTITESN